MAAALLTYQLVLSYSGRISYAQLAAFPLFATLMALFLPKRVFITGTVAAVIAFSVPYFRALGANVYIATLTNDPLENDSRVLSKILQGQIKLHGGRSVRLYKTFAKERNAEKFLRKKSASAVVWGTKDYLKVSFKKQPPIRLFGFSIIGSVSKLVIANDPAPDTARFLGALLSAISRKDIKTSEAIVELQFAAGQQSLWKSGSHKAVPYFLLGNGYLQLAFTNGHYQAAYLECALNAYQKAISYLYRPEHNLELYFAVLNNKAVATYLSGHFEGQKFYKKRARLLLKRTLKEIKRKKLARLFSEEVEVLAGNFANSRVFSSKRHGSKKKLVKKLRRRRKNHAKQK